MTATPQQLAQAAVDFGRATRAAHVRVDADRFEVSASHRGVVVTRVAQDLLMREHPAYGDNPVTVIDQPVSAYSHESVDPADRFDAAEQLMADTGALLVRAAWGDGQELFCTRAEAQLIETREVPRRFLPGTRTARVTAARRAIHV